MASGTPLESPVAMGSYPLLATLLLTAGLATTSAFFVYEVRATKYSKKLSQELGLAAASSVLLGLGAFFLLLWSGVYV